MGIAVGMATNIPPHNLGELIDALHFLLGHTDMDSVTIDELVEFVK
jgi:DNA gyrase/topoisomerase IV subunit A